ncbi:MAG: ATP-dependent helicase HrpB, partial [Blastocatellia bacterium]|nr:ATP-dependent helicase HrpB [Blastocatellia bacterium]
QRGGLIEELRRLLTTQQSNLLQQMAPEYTSLPGRKQIRINYQQGKKPWIESRLQDFFGLLSSPKIVGGQVTLVAHLLAPNMRPVQVTSDLTSFWQRTYKEVRKELSRKYPRHNWPEDPLVKTVNKT